MKYFIETYGCQMNVHDSERMAGLLEQSGYDPADSDRDADIVVVNTCSVRERAEEKLYTRLGEIREMARETGRDPIVAVTGCVAQQEGETLLARSPGIIDIIAGTQRLKMLPILIEQKREHRAFPAIDITTPYDEPSFPLGITRRGDPIKAYVTIIEGCNDFCSFCVVPYTRGHERMRPKAEIMDEVRARGRRWAQGSAAARTNRESLSGARRSMSVTSRGCSRRSTRLRASSESGSRARIRATPAIG